jgi:Schlafen, AlbA_2
MTDDALLLAALSRTSECADTDFKASFDPSESGAWLELIKDIVALANSGGGTILIGLDDDGAPSGTDVSAVLSLDPADITNKIHKYTNTHFHQFEVLECRKADSDVCALRVFAADMPLVFTRVGTYEISPGRQKTVFSVGTVYFRHGAKSEPGTTDDLRHCLMRQIEATRRSWLDGIAKVVEAPSGSRVAILPPESHRQGPSGAVPLRLTNDPDATPYYAVPLDKTHPFRQKELVKEVNARLSGRRSINSHNIVCIRRVYEVQNNLTFCYTQNYASPRYSQAFADWIVAQYEANSNFFEETKAKFDERKRRDA